jgi:kumamolisin
MSGNNRKLLAVASAIGLTCLFLLTVFAPNAFLALNLHGRFQLTGDTPSVVRQSTLEHHADESQTMKIVVGLKLRDEAGLDRLLSEIADPRSPNFRKYLTPADFAGRFSPLPQDVDNVVIFLQERGLSVTNVSPNRTLIEAEGTVGQLEAAFGVTINKYTVKLPNGGVKTYLSNDRDPVIPTRLSAIIESVMGLDTYAEFESRMRAKEPHSNATAPRGFSPQEISKVYDYPNTLNPNVKGTALTGKGKTIAVATAYTYDQKDIDAYWKQFNITRTGTLTNEYIGGTATKLNEETTLDLQTVSGLAPGADVIMYLGVDAKFTNFTLVFNKIVTDNKADIMSISWGLCEEHTGKRQMKTEHNIFRQAASQGIAIFAASGDDGAYDCKHEEEEDENGKKKPVVKLAVDYPSSDPYVTAVGGTTLYSSGGKRSSERAWYGSGGGNSEHWKRPSWQKGAGVPAGDYRSTADVSLNASPGTAYAFYFEGKWEGWGGTSVAAPAWAALWALIDEAAGERIGMPVETLYRLGDSADYGPTFYDITSGDNGDFRGPGFKAGDHWDHPTGWGVPKGEALKDWIVGDRKGKSPARAPLVEEPEEDETPASVPAEPSGG